MKEKFKKYISYPKTLYASGDNNPLKYKEDNLKQFSKILFIISLLLGLLGAGVLLLHKNVSHDISDIVLSIFLLYMSGVSLFMFFSTLLLRSLIFTSPKNGCLKCLKIGCSYFIFFITLLISIPLLLVFKLLELCVGYRANNIDNFLIGLLLVPIRLLILLIVWSAILKSKPTAYLIDYVSNVITSHFDYIDPIPLAISFFILIVELVEFAVSKIFYFVYEKHLRKTKNEHSTTSVEYDMRYIKSTNKMSLFFNLVMIFFIIMMSTEESLPIKSDLVNVVTLFSLVVLYFDKRREAVTETSDIAK